MNRLLEKYNKDVIPAFKEKFGYKNSMAIPRIKKVVINIGAGQGLQDSNFIEQAEQNLIMITGQKPVKTKAKKSISNFKIREGMILGLKVTLRRKRMYDFIDKLINITLPRIRDFRGLNPKSLDGNGNLTLGFKEHIAFPEIQAEGIEKLHGLEVSIQTSANNNEQALFLLKELVFPFKDKDK